MAKKKIKASLQKSLDEMEQLAEDLLNKSEDLDKEDDADKDEDVEAKDISEDAEDEDEDEDEEDDEESEDADEDVKKSLENTVASAKSGAVSANGTTKGMAGKSDAKKDEDIDEKKKVKENFEDNDDISKALEVSDFLSAITTAMTDAIGSLNGRINKSLSGNDAILGTFAKSFHSIAQSQQTLIENNTHLRKSLRAVSEQVETMNAKIEELEGQPTMRKSVRDIRVMGKDFKKSIGNQEGEELSKSEVLAGLNDLIMKGDTSVSPLDIIGFESGAPLKPEIAQKVNQLYNK